MTNENVSLEKCLDYFNPPKPEGKKQGSWVACAYASKIPIVSKDKKTTQKFFE